MAEAIAHIPTANASKYVSQVCNWTHKLDVVLTDEAGIVCFPAAIATMTPAADTLAVHISADDAPTLERMKQVLASHLDRFAFREAPLPFDWQPVA
jgi:hypothetical protein